MSLSSSQARVQYTLSGSGQTLTVPYKFIAGSDLGVVKTPAAGGADVPLVLNTDYTVSGGGSLPATGAITLTAGATGDIITIYRNAQILQPAVYAPNDAFPAKTTETALDRVTMEVQQLGLLTERALRLPIARPATGELTTGTWANKMLGFDANGIPTPSDPVGATSLTGTVIEVTSLSALRAVVVTALTTGRQARTSGYSSTGDGGNGTFVYNSASSATDDNGTIIQPTSGSGRWLRAYEGNISPRWFGAKGDDSTNDTTAVQAAVNLAKSSGGRAFLPAGTYQVDGINIADVQGLTVIGEGRLKTIIKARALCAAVLNLSGSLHSLTFRDFGVDGSLGSGVGINFDNSNSGFLYDSEFSDVTVQSCASHGWQLRSAFSIALRGCGANNNLGDQFRAWGGPGVVFDSCIFGGAVSGASGFRIISTASLLNCNGDFAASPGDWGKFGGDGGSESDLQTGFPSLYMLNCNVEDFQSKGLNFIEAYNLTRLENCQFLSAINSSNVVAIQSVGSVGGKALEIHGCSFDLKSGSSWKNSLPIHVNSGASTALVSGGNLGSTTTFYNDSAAGVYPVLTMRPGTNDSRTSIFGQTGGTHYGAHEFDYLARYRMGNAAAGSDYSDFMAAAAMPSSGTWRNGDVVWAVNTATTEGNFTLIGWKRITTGSGNVLNTDWVKLYAGQASNKILGASGLILDSDTHVVDVTDGSVTGPALRIKASSGNASIVGGNLNASANSRFSWIGFQARTVQFGYVNDALGTYTEYSRFQNDGTLKFASGVYADGTLSVASGVVTSSSDARLKHKKTKRFTRGLAAILALNPLQYRWKARETGVKGNRFHAGFIAQEVREHIPEAISENPESKMLGLSDRAIIAALVNAVKELNSEIEKLRDAKVR